MKNGFILTVNGGRLQLPEPDNGHDYKLKELYSFIDGTYSGKYKNEDPCVEIINLHGDMAGLIFVGEDNAIALGLPTNFQASILLANQVIQDPTMGIVGDCAIIKTDLVE